MTRPGQKDGGFAGNRPYGGADQRPGNNARGLDHPNTSRKPRGPRAS